jgi:hypothetical protein
MIKKLKPRAIQRFLQKFSGMIESYFIAIPEKHKREDNWTTIEDVSFKRTPLSKLANVVPVNSNSPEVLDSWVTWVSKITPTENNPCYFEFFESDFPNLNEDGSPFKDQLENRSKELKTSGFTQEVQFVIVFTEGEDKGKDNEGAIIVHICTDEHDAIIDAIHQFNRKKIDDYFGNENDEDEEQKEQLMMWEEADINSIIRLAEHIDMSWEF